MFWVCDAGDSIITYKTEKKIVFFFYGFCGEVKGKIQGDYLTVYLCYGPREIHVNHVADSSCPSDGRR